MRLLSLALLLFIAQLSYAAPLKNIVVFGDSLSDNGNLYEYMHHQLPQSPPYYQGRFSNGPIWAESLAQSYFGQDAKAHLLDYAFGGAGIIDNPTEDDDDVLFTLNREIDAYLLSHDGKASTDSLFIVWIGGNNYLGLPEDTNTAVNEVISGIEKGLKRLVNAGAQHIVMVNLPNLANTPLAREFEAPEAFNTLSTLHNEKLAAHFEALHTAYPQVQWIYFDVNQIFQGVLNHAAQFGFNNIQDSCADNRAQATPVKHTLLKMTANMAPNKLASDACNQYFFFDLLHPTERVHTITAEHFRHLLNQEHVKFETKA